MSLAKNIGKIVGKGMKVSSRSAEKVTKPKTVKSPPGQKLKMKESLKPFVDKLDDNGNVVKSMSNIYTGKELNPLYSKIGAGAVAVATVAQIQRAEALAPITVPITASKKNIEQGGPPEIMLYDGVGQESAPRNLNAHGDLVFGLHNQRKG